MRQRCFIFGLLCATIFLSGCGTINNTTRGGLIGGGSGAVLGATIGGLTGHGKGAAIGAVIGSAIGTGTGVLIGKKMDKAAKQAECIEGAKVEQITDSVSGLKTVRVTFDSGILFITRKSNLNTTAQASLSKFANLVLLKNPDMDVIIKGYTDNQGWINCSKEESRKKNVELSQMRAQSVTSYLIDCGISTSQIKEVYGFGESNPIASNDTEIGRQQNRRVEVYMIASEKMILEAKNKYHNNNIQ